MTAGPTNGTPSGTAQSQRQRCTNSSPAVLQSVHYACSWSHACALEVCLCINCPHGIEGGPVTAQVLAWCEAGEWRCPACLGLCNCSGSGCQRKQRGMEPTDQLISEATYKGFRSVGAAL